MVDYVSSEHADEIGRHDARYGPDRVRDAEHDAAESAANIVVVN